MNPNIQKKIVAPKTSLGPGSKYWPSKDPSSLYPENWILIDNSHPKESIAEIRNFQSTSLDSNNKDWD